MVQLNFSFETPSALLTPDEIFCLSGGELLRRLILKEDRRIERKPPGVQPRLLGDYYSMWSNTAPSGGLIVIGMEDDGSLTGCHLMPDKRINELEKAAFIYCSEARTESKRIFIKATDGLDSFLLLVRAFYRDDKVVLTSSGEGFIRIADSKHEMSADEIRELQIDKGQLDFEQESAQINYPEDFNAVLVRRYIDSLKHERKPLHDHSDEELMEHRHLGRRRGCRFVPNNACCLVLSKDPLGSFPGCKISTSILRFCRFPAGKQIY